MKEIRDMDGIYFRVKRDGKWMDLCFSDLTSEEQDKVMAGKDTEWLKQLAKFLAADLYATGAFVERGE